MKRNIEIRFINAIQNGKLDEVKSFWLKPSEIDKPFYIQKLVKVVNKSKIYPFSYISEPTPLILAILCEQPEILQYLIDTFHPSFSLSINGWLPIHYAACTGDYKCLQVLLQYESIQENIDVGIKVSGSKSTNTALHVAVSNHLHAQTLLLSSPLPDIIFDKNNKRLETPLKSPYKPANPLLLTSTGCSPLHLAVKCSDIDMIKILLYIKSDLSIKNNDGFTALEMAKDSGDQEIIKLLEIGTCDEDLTSNYIKSVEKQEVDSNPSEVVVQQTESAPKVEETASREEVKKLSNSVNNVAMIVQELQRRVDAIESENKKPEFDVCCLCGNITTSHCNKCNNCICENCLQNHSC